MNSDQTPGGPPRDAEERRLFLAAGAADFNPEPGTTEWAVQRCFHQFRRGILTEQEAVQKMIEVVRDEARGV